MSIGQQVADPLPSGLRAERISNSEAESFLEGALRWDAATSSFVAMPPPVPDVTADQIRNWMASSLGMNTAEIDDAFRQAAGVA